MRRTGFSLVEVTLAVALMVALATTVAGLMRPHLDEAGRVAAARDRSALRSARALYSFEHDGRLPGSDDELVGRYVLVGAGAAGPSGGGR